MKRSGLLIAIFVTLFLTGAAITHLGRPRAKPQVSVQEPDLTSAAARRWLSGQPHHWRALLLHR